MITGEIWTLHPKVFQFPVRLKFKWLYMNNIISTFYLIHFWFLIFFVNFLVYYEPISGKSCTEATTTSKNLAYSNCDGWKRTNLESCKQKCINNELPSGCPTTSFSCKFVKWDDNKDWPPGWCQVADSNCVLSSDVSVTHTLELKTGDAFFKRIFLTFRITQF